MSYIIPSGEMALAEQVRKRQQAVTDGIKYLAKKLVVSEDSLVDRDPDYVNDFILPSQGAALVVGLSGWLTAPFAAAATAYSVFANNTPAAVATVQVPNDQAWVFFGAHVLTLNDPVTQLFFMTGTAANRKAQFDMEKLYTKLETDGYFTDPVVYGPSEWVTCQVRSRVALGAAVGCRFVIKTVIIEPLQKNLT